MHVRDGLQALAGRLVGLGPKVLRGSTTFEETGKEWRDEGAEDNLGASVVAISIRGYNMDGAGSTY